MGGGGGSGNEMPLHPVKSVLHIMTAAVWRDWRRGGLGVGPSQGLHRSEHQIRCPTRKSAPGPCVSGGWVGGWWERVAAGWEVWGPVNACYASPIVLQVRSPPRPPPGAGPPPAAKGDHIWSLSRRVLVPFLVAIWGLALWSHSPCFRRLYPGGSSCSLDSPGNDSAMSTNCNVYLL